MAELELRTSGDIRRNNRNFRDPQESLLESLDYDEIEEKFGWQKIKKNGKYGVIYNGKVVCDCIYDDIDDERSSLPFLKVRQGEKYGLISVEGEILFDLEYDDLEFYHGKPYIGVKKDNKRGLRHATKSNKTECIYDKIINHLGKNYFYISVNGKWGVLNEEVEVIIEPQFKEVYEYSMNIIGVKKFKIGQTAKQGQVEGEQKISVSNDVEKAGDDKTEKIAIFNGEGKQLSDFVYDSINLNLMDEWNKEDNIMNYTRKEMLVMKIGDHKGILDEIGEFLPAEYDDFGDKWTEGLLPAKKNGKWGVINEKGEKIVDFMYDGIKSFLGGLAIVELNGKQGLINNIGEVILEPKLDNVRNLGEGMGGFNENGEPWFINNKGEKLKKIEYNSIGEFKGGIVAVQQGGKWGFIDKDLNLICDLKYDGVGNFCNGRAIVKKDNKYGFIDKKGNEICDIKYEDVELFREGMAIVKRDGKYGVINMEGDEIYFGLEGTLMNFGGGLIAAWEKIDKKTYRCYFIDKNGKEIGKDRGYSTTVSTNGAAIARKNGQYILLNEQGEEVDRDWDLKSEWINSKK